MAKQKMTVHRALAELKLLDSRIQKGIQGLVPVGLQQKDKLVNNVYALDEFQDNAKSKLQSVQDLIERKERIKSLILEANAETKVKIGEVEMTVAEAINYKAIVPTKRNLVNHLKACYASVKSTMNDNNQHVHDQAIRLAEAALQKDNVKIDDKDSLAITGPYKEANEFKLIDPIGIEKFIEELEEQIDVFESEVDAVLSESNSLTIIEV